MPAWREVAAGGLVPVKLALPILLLAALVLAAGDSLAAPPDSVPPPASKPAKTSKADPSKKPTVAKPALRGPVTTATTTSPAAAPAPVALTAATTSAIKPPGRSFPALAMTTSAATSPLDVAAVKQAIDLVRRSQIDEATKIQSSISDPLARKVIEWVLLRSDDGSSDFSRYTAFIAANPGWPSIVTLRRRAEAAAWQQRADADAVIAFFRNDLPLTGKGWFSLARALLAKGDRARAQEAVRVAWRETAFSPDVEAQARDLFAGLITTADDKARMDARFYADDEVAAMSAARHLDGTEMAIAKARSAVANKSASAKPALDAVPQAARRDPGYIFSRVQWLRRAEKISEAGQLIVTAPNDAAALHDVEQWWVERRVLARKLLDKGDYKLAYEVANGAAPPATENHRVEQQFTAGWIALRFLNQPAVALNHFAQIAEGISNPIALARSFYWQGRAAEAMGRTKDAKTALEAAAQYPTAYYGQLARARLGLNEVTLRAPPEPSSDLRGLEVARAMEILYAIDARDLVNTLAADVADKSTDAAALVTLAEIAMQHNDARATLFIGKAALGHGLPLEFYAFPAFGVPEYQQVGPNVEPCVVYSIVRQESAFNAHAISSVGAVGLMQVMPSSGRTIAKRVNLPFDQRRLLDDVTYNAQIGTAELGDVINDYRGSYILAFASYNAGRRRVKEWIEQYGDPRDKKIDPVDWIERIPFSETRNYVERVIENMQVYRARIENNSKLLIEADLRRGG
jgi:soluble lytic murein transglycosylase